ncbi:hypothetical protein O1611_g3165 [Lasiodiplodia mahajangana]|uniref:Uncharacterized protein n=1 Tax=Lasiodiplodia mahajangana TaxID=1108764 RepID=A0ACC2JT70_9PEZI|nr:hypothetical protein O1611_g3165 [Lasiodiplodia mahajangana]
MINRQSEMSPFTEDSVKEYWDDTVKQLDAHTETRTIKLSLRVFHKLGIHGQNYFKHGASLALNGPAEFYADGSDPDRVYLGIGDELIRQYHFTVAHSHGCSMPVMVPPPVPMTPRPQHITNFPLAQARLPMPYQGFNYQTPPQAPRYPMQSPGLMLMMSPTPGSLSAQKRNVNGQPIQNNLPPTPQSLGPVNNAQDDEDEEVNEENHVKRPPNAFMFFRQEQAPIVARENPGVHNGAISKLVSAKWRSLSRQQQQPWYDKQAEAAEEHKRLHPGWKFTPGQKKGKRPAKRARPNAQQPQQQFPQPHYPGLLWLPGQQQPSEQPQPLGQPAGLMAPRAFDAGSSQNWENDNVPKYNFSQAQEAAANHAGLGASGSADYNPIIQPELNYMEQDHYSYNPFPADLEMSVGDKMKGVEGQLQNINTTNNNNNAENSFLLDMNKQGLVPHQGVAAAEDGELSQEVLAELERSFLDLDSN